MDLFCWLRGQGRNDSWSSWPDTFGEPPGIDAKKFRRLRHVLAGRRRGLAFPPVVHVGTAHTHLGTKLLMVESGDLGRIAQPFREG